MKWIDINSDIRPYHQQKVLIVSRQREYDYVRYDEKVGFLTMYDVVAWSEIDTYYKRCDICRWYDKEVEEWKIYHWCMQKFVHIPTAPDWVCEHWEDKDELDN